MHFIEQIFHIAPDGGTGILELAIALVVVVLPLGVLALRRKRQRAIYLVTDHAHMELSEAEAVPF